MCLILAYFVSLAVYLCKIVCHWKRWIFTQTIINTFYFWWWNRMFSVKCWVQNIIWINFVARQLSTWADVTYWSVRHFWYLPLSCFFTQKSQTFGSEFIFLQISLMKNALILVQVMRVAVVVDLWDWGLVYESGCGFGPMRVRFSLWEWLWMYETEV
jgi:hypothetical protein